MATQQNGAQGTVIIDGTQYIIDDLSEAAKTQLASIQYVEREIEEAKRRISVLQAARQFYAISLARELPAK